jgi:hypothetical protein
MDNWTEGPKAYIRITRKFYQRLGDISLEDVRKEGFQSLDEFKHTWESIHGVWQPDLIVIAYEFEIVG